ncbi:MAG: aspartate ammonia-lyase [Bacteroidales bacterium]|nr:aspartate ammonia-lyase [Bacteroidales bacterium]
MDFLKIKEFLHNVELLRDLTDDELTIAAEQAAVKTFEEGSYLFKRNEPRKEIFFVVSGKIELFKATPTGKEKFITSFREYDFLGEGSLLDSYPHSTSARAEEESTALCLDIGFFQTHGAIAVKVMSNISRVISRRLRYAVHLNSDDSAQYESGRTRTEHDLLGEREVPYEYYYGIQTLRALENFNISGVRLNFYPELVKSLAIVKMAAAKANHDLGLLSKEVADAIVRACQEIIDHHFLNHFVVDMIQGGAGTSTNMNANEVIANRALELLGHHKGEYRYCHPNNHVNLSQSTNDVYPTAIQLALFRSNENLVNVLQQLIDSFRAKSVEFASVIKMGRTQLQDAVPMTLGQTFGAFATTLEEEIMRLNENAKLFLEINMGGTAIGTGLNANPRYSGKVVAYLRQITDLDIELAPDLVEATQDTGQYVIYSSAVKRLAIKLSKICNDLRLLSSGPRAGLNEINLPPMQPGSTIMPGKVNPVIPEVVNQIAFKVIGNDLTVSFAAEAGQLELNVMEPVIVQSLLQSIEMLKNGMDSLRYRCVDGITANAENCRKMVEKSIGLVTALNPFIGYENSTLIAKEALETGASVYDLVLEKKLLSKKELDRILDPETMIRPETRES